MVMLLMETMMITMMCDSDCHGYVYDNDNDDNHFKMIMNENDYDL